LPNGSECKPSSLSFHLAQLTHAGLITQRRFSRQLIYSADYGAMGELLTYLTENCCGKGTACAPACNPADSFTKGETNKAPARARVG
jgi:ArsR family transcriptional regulator, arsenate/arsenite/antimonite-responsive transcriptional repressor